MSAFMPIVIRPGAGSGPPVLLLHSWWGLNRSFADYAGHLADAGFLAGCVDLFNGRTASSETEARALRALPRREPMYRTIIRAIEALAADTGASVRRVALVGFSMGGHWTLWFSQRPELPISAAVVHYAARSADFCLTDWPILAHFAENDPFVSTSARRGMEKALARACRPYTAFDYPGTGHWFAESADTNFDADAADLALARTIAFLKALHTAA